MIVRADVAANEPFRGQPVNQTDGAVVPDRKPLGKLAGGDGLAAGEALDRQQCLVLARPEPFPRAAVSLKARKRLNVARNSASIS